MEVADDGEITGTKHSLLESKHNGREPSFWKTISNCCVYSSGKAITSGLVFEQRRVRHLEQEKLLVQMYSEHMYMYIM